MNLRSLPEGASYSDKQGQANVKLKIVNDTVFVEASCDSLSLKCEKLERDIIRIRSDTESEIKEVRSNTFQMALQWCCIGFVAGIGLTVLLIVFILKFKK